MAARSPLRRAPDPDLSSPGLYLLGWIALAPLLVAILHARSPETLQLDESQKLLAATPWQGFLLGYGCGIAWYLGTCYWVYDTMHQYGGLASPIALFVMLLFALYLGLYHGAFGLLLSLLAGAIPTIVLPWCRPLPLGRGRTRSHARQRLSVGSPRHYAGR
jgi:apolipoprotein N-acyltransferase